MDRKVLDKERVNSVLLAICISVNMIIVSINQFIPINIGVILIIIFLISILLNRSMQVWKNIRVIKIFCLLICLYLFSYLRLSFNPYFKEYFISFICFGLIPAYIAVQRVDYRKVLIAISNIYLYTFWILFYIDIDKLSPGNKMGMGYNIIIPIIVSLYLILKEKNKFKYLFLIVFYGYFSIIISSRGSILAILVYILLAGIKNIRKIYTKIFYLIFISLLIYLIYNNFYEILLLSEKILGNFKIESSFINHTLHQMQVSDFSNGRNDIYKIALDYIKQSPILGNGVAYFEYFNIKYVHNFVIQLMVEGGLFVTIPILSILFYGLLKVLVKYDKDDCSEFILILASMIIPKLMFSSILWKEQIFWILIVIILKRKNRRGECRGVIQ